MYIFMEVYRYVYLHGGVMEVWHNFELGQCKFDIENEEMVCRLPCAQISLLFLQHL